MTRTILTVALAAIFGVGGTIASRIQTTPEEDASELALKNIEALGNEEDDCHYVNGYKRWKTERPWFWTDQESFFDCCAKRVTGYSPEGECR